MAQAQMTVSDEVAIKIQDMNKWYGSFHVLRRTGEALQTASRIHQKTPCKR